MIQQCPMCSYYHDPEGHDPGWAFMCNCGFRLMWTLDGKDHRVGCDAVPMAYERAYHHCECPDRFKLIEVDPEDLNSD